MTDQMLAFAFGSFMAGVLLTVLIQIWIFAMWFCSLPVDLPESNRSQYIPFRLAKELKLATEKIDPNKYEDFLCMNILMQFIFQENKDTRKFRNWIMDKVHVEFDDLLKSMAGKMLHHLSVRDLNIGSELPVLSKVKLLKADMKNNRLEEIIIEADVTYSGSFQLGVNVGSVLGRAFFAIVLSKLVGTIHLKLTREPFTHWSVSFVKDPVLEFEVESQYLGRQFTKITSFITNLFRRMIRKKHTLPNFKIRYRPFFSMPKSNRPDKIDTLIDGKSLTKGKLEVKLIEITRLKDVDTELYCLLTIDDHEWNEKTALPPITCLPSCIKKNNEINAVIMEDNLDYVNINLASVSNYSMSQQTVPVTMTTASNGSTRHEVKEDDDYNKSELESEIENILNDKELCGNLLNESGKDFEQESDSSQEIFDLPGCKCHRMRKTNIYKPSRDITCNQIFTYESLMESDRYLNITVVQYTPPVKDKVGRILTRDKHIPMAYVSVDIAKFFNLTPTVSLSLNDIATQCLTTKHSNTLQCIQLNMAPGLTKIGTTRRTSYVDLVGKKGFNENLCNGDIRLLFKHTPFSVYSNHAPDYGSEEETFNAENNYGQDNSTNPLKGDKASKVHAFLRTNFHNVTYCKFCHKKIWLKTAFQCRKCLMVCHKKCTERCMIENLCTNKKTSRLSVISSQSEMDTRLQSRGSKSFVPNLNRLKRKNSNVQASNTNNSANANIKSGVSELKEFNFTVVNQKMKRKSLNNVSDLCASSAKEMGKELFSTMEPTARQNKLNDMISQVKDEIMKESMQREQLGGDTLDSSYDERIETLNLLMLHYCSGLNHCLQEIADSSNNQHIDQLENTDNKFITQKE